MAFKRKWGPFNRTVKDLDGNEITLVLRIVPEEDAQKPVKESGALVGWSGLTDTETGAPLEFNDANVADVMADPVMSGLIVREIGALYTDAFSGELARGN